MSCKKSCIFRSVVVRECAGICPSPAEEPCEGPDLDIEAYAESLGRELDPDETDLCLVVLAGRG